MKKRSTLLLSCIFLLALVACAQQDKSKRPSPPGSAQCKNVKVDYSSPHMKGRKIFGSLVPYGEVWRAGANEATKFVTTADVMVGDKKVPAGSYTLFVIPNQDKWTLIISKKTGEWGIPYPGEGQDFARTDMKVSPISSPVENFTIGFDEAAGGCTLHMDWENTRASVDIK
jgi:hypothetical protein